MNRRVAQCDTRKECKKKACSCYHKHTWKISCVEGCDDFGDAKCLPIKIRKSYNRTINERLI